LDRTCPQCGKANIRRSRDGSWYCWKKTDGCGAVYDAGDPTIDNQDVEDFTPSAEDIDTGGYPAGSSQAAAYVAKRKIETGHVGNHVSWKSMAEMAKAFEAIREQVGEVEYHAELERWGWTKFQDIRAALDSRDAAARERSKQNVIECYSHLMAIARKEGR
jgi:hypothetical protein